MEELLDCKYEWCGRTGAHGFKREDHRKEHYRKVHKNESEYPKMGKGGRSGRGGGSSRQSRPAVSTTHNWATVGNQNKPMQIPTKDRMPIAIEGPKPMQSPTEDRIPIAIEGPKPMQSPTEDRIPIAMEGLVIASRNLRTSGKSTDAVARVKDLELPKIDANSGDKESTESKVLVPDSDAVMSESLGTSNVGLLERTSTPQEDDKIEFSEGKDSSSCSDDESHSTEDKLAVIKSHVLKALSASGENQYCALLKTQWDILGFMEDQFRENDFPNSALGPVVTIIGSAQHAQATTCSEYIRLNWPAHGSKVLGALQDALKSTSRKSQLSIVARVDDGSVFDDGASSRHAELEFNVTHGYCFINIKSGTPDIIVDVVQQLAWMGSALRTSSDDRVQYCEPKLERALKAEGSEPAMFNVTYEMSSLGEEDRSCWFPLFTNPVIARGFPVPKRENGEQGLEVPLEMMAALGGARYVTAFEGGLVLKGFSTMFVPIQRHKQSIQWHLIQHSDGERMLYRQLGNECLRRAMLDEVNHESLRTTRAFLGWWKSSETHLGTGDSAYDRIDWSPAGEAKRPTRWSGGNIGFQTMITGQLNFILGAKDGRLHFSQKGPFQRIVQCAEKTPVALYDLEDHRAWLVPALDVMLHIVQTRHHLSPYRIGGGDIELTPVNPENGRGAATEAVAANQLRELYERDVASDKSYYFKDAILDIWSQMERLMEKDDTIEAYPGLALHGTMRSRIHGWEYMSLVHEKNYRRKEAIIAKSSGGWADLVSDIDALVLFATGFGEIIRPGRGLRRLCHRWRSLPKDKDYLAANVPILELLYSEAGSRVSHKHLSTTHLQWHRGSTLFEECFYTGQDRCGCDRTQQIYHDSMFKTFGPVRPHGKLEENGCIVFGQAYHPFWPTKTNAVRKNTVHMLPNSPIRAAAITKNVTGRDDTMISPSPPTSISSESGEFSDFGSGNPKRLPSPLSDPVVQEEAIPPRGRRNMSHLQKRNLDTFADPKNINDQTSLPDDCAICPVDYQMMFKHNLQSQGKRLVSAQTASPSEAESAPVHARKLVHRNGNGCPCATCPVEDFEPPGSIEFVDTTNDARRSTTKVVERRQRQALLP